MSTCVHFLAIKDPQLPYVDISHLMIRDYARKIGAQFNVITTRKFPSYPVAYEALQIHEMGSAYDWNIYFKPGVLLGESLPDLTSIANKDYVGISMKYSLRSNFTITKNPILEKDARDIGLVDFALLTSKVTHNLWKPLEGEYSAHSMVTKDNAHERFSSFALSQNFAEYGYQFCGLLPKGAHFDFIEPHKVAQKPVEQYVAETVRKWRQQSPQV